MHLDSQLFESSPDCTKLLSVDGRLVAMNRNGRCLMEVEDFAQIEGASWATLWPEAAQWQVTDAIGRAAGGGTARFQAFCPTAKGSPRWWDVTVTPMRDGTGAIETLLSVSRDITEVQLARESQRATAARLQLVLDASGVGEWEMDPATGQARTSLQHDRCFGLEEPAQDWSLERFMGFVHRDDRARVSRLFEQFGSEGTPIAFECRITWEDGSDHWIRVRGTPYRNSEGATLRLVGTVQDISESKWTEEELREMSQDAVRSAQAVEGERARLDALLEAVPIGIAYADRDGGLVLVNAANRTLWGEHPLSKNVGAYVEWKGWWADGSERHGRRIEPNEWGLARALSGEEVTNDLIEIEPFDSPGQRRSVLLRATPVRKKDGSIGGAVVAQMDITDRVRAEAELRRSEARFRTIANAMPQMVWSTLPDGYHDFYNRQWHEFTGVPPDSTHGESWKDVFHPEDQARAWALWNRSLRTGEMYEVEYRLRHHSGEYRWVLGRALPVRNASGEVLRWMGTCTDIHENKLAQAALTDSEARFRALADNIPQLAWMTDSSGSVFWYNDRWFEYTGTTFETMQGSGWRAVHHPEHIERVAEKFRRHVEMGVGWEDTFPLRGRDGEYRWFLSRAVPLRDASGAITRWFGTNTDVTEQREAENALREAGRRKDEFLAMLAHELRNPLAPISTAAELLRMPTLPATQARNASAIIARQVRHMTELVDDLLDVSRVTRGLITLEMDAFDVREAVRGAIEQVRPLIEARQHTLATRISSTPLWVHGDRTRLTQVMANLVNNAAKYTPPGGQITVDAHRCKTGISISVRDTGNGIEPSLLPHVFELFTQGSRTPDRAQGGLGIGLALVRSLVNLHGGTVNVQSSGAGEGSLFIVRLPAAVQEAPHVAAAGDVPAMSAGTLRIDIVDDNEDAAETLALLLLAHGHQVRTFHSAEAALAQAESDAADVYVLDIGLPGMDGHSLARRLRMLPQARDAMLLALSGYGQDTDVQASLAAGFDDHFVKPLDPARLADALARLTSQAPKVELQGG